MKKIILLSSLLLFVFACQNKTEKELEIPSDSIFNLSSTWQNQDGKDMQLSDLKGKTLVVVMIYTTCKSACPILVADMKKIATAIDKKKLNDVSLVLVSIDPEHDKPEVLKEFAQKNEMDDSHWTFLRSSVENTQEFANVLSMKYKEISPMDFSHSNIISVFAPNGHLVKQEEGLGIDTKKVADLVNKTVAEN